MILIWRTRQDHQINLRHYRFIYTTSMGFCPHRIEICQFKILPTAFSEQTAKYNFRQYFCLYGMCILLISKGLHGVITRSLESVLIPSSISVAFKGSQVSPKMTWMIVKINHYHDSTGAYHDSEYYHDGTDCR